MGDGWAAKFAYHKRQNTKLCTFLYRERMAGKYEKNKKNLTFMIHLFRAFFTRENLTNICDFRIRKTQLSTQHTVVRDGNNESTHYVCSRTASPPLTADERENVREREKEGGRTRRRTLSKKGFHPVLVLHLAKQHQKNSVNIWKLRQLEEIIFNF